MRCCFHVFSTVDPVEPLREQWAEDLTVLITSLEEQHSIFDMKITVVSCDSTQVTSPSCIRSWMFMSERTFRELSTLKVSINHCLNKVVVCTVAILLAISKCCEFYTKSTEEPIVPTTTHGVSNGFFLYSL